VLQLPRVFSKVPCCTGVPCKASNPYTWTGFEITYSSLNLFIPHPPLSLTTRTRAGSPVTHSGCIFCNRPLAKELRWSVLCTHNQRSHTRLLYMFKVLKCGVCNKYLRLFSSEQEFCVAQGICGQKGYVVHATDWFIK